MSHRLGVVLAFVLGARAAIAQDSAGPIVKLTLHEALERARAHSARLAELTARESAAAAGWRGARAARLPQLDLSAGYTRLSGVPELAFQNPTPPPAELVVFPNIPNTYRARAEVSIPLYTGGRVAGGVAAADAQRVAAGRDLEGAVKDLALETSTAYWSLVTARDTAIVLAESLASFEAHLKDAKNRVELGMAARNELLSVEVEADRAELARLQAANTLTVANENMLRLLDLPPGTQVEPAEDVAAEPFPQADKERLVADAIAARPELLALRSRIGAAEAEARVARAASLPQTALNAGYDLARPNARILPLADEWKGSWSVGVSVSYAAFDGGRASAAVAGARAQAEALRQQLKDLEWRVRLEVTSRVGDIDTGGAALRVAGRGLEAARENVRVAQDRYREGVSASSDLLDAETRLLRAGLDRTNAVASLNLARAGLARAVGR